MSDNERFAKMPSTFDRRWSLARDVLQHYAARLFEMQNAAIALAQPEPAPTPAAQVQPPSVPSHIIQAVSKYGDARADGLQAGEALGAAITAMRQWAGTLTKPETPPSASVAGLEQASSAVQGEAVPIGYVSAEQIALIRDGDGEAGVYIPMRSTPAGKFTQAIYTHPAPPASASTASREPDMRAVCEALGFDPTNHHNAAKCPYCRPTPTPAPEARKPLTRQEAAKRWAELTAEMEILAPLLGMRRIQPSDVAEESAPTPAPEAMLSDMDRAVLTMPADIAFAGEMAQLQYHARVQSLLKRIDAQHPADGAEGGKA